MSIAPSNSEIHETNFLINRFGKGKRKEKALRNAEIGNMAKNITNSFSLKILRRSAQIENFRIGQRILLHTQTNY